MSDTKSQSTKDILNTILNDEKLLSSRAFRDKVYTDQPILKRASQIKTPDTPQKIKDMKALAYTPEAHWKTSAWLFYTQGKFMEDYSDVYDYSTGFVKFFPTYRDLDVQQLRGFFSWRSRVREGQFPEAPLPFVYMYAYELINGIGVSSPEEGLAQLQRLGLAYSGMDPELKKLLTRWELDYCVYNQLPPELIDSNPDIRYDNALLKLIHWKDTADNELFEALTELSSYQVESSRFYMQYPDDFIKASVCVFRELALYFCKHRKNEVCDKFFGHITDMSCRMFDSAVFYDRNTSASFDYSINEIHSYTCRNGLWRCTKYYGSRSKSPQLGDLLKLIDRIMRERYDFRYKLRSDGSSKTTASLIKKVLDAIDAEKQKKQAMTIEIDVSKLDSIRAAADITRDKLIVEEEEDIPEIPVFTEDVPEDTPESTSPLTANEISFLKALLSGGDWAASAKNSGEMPSILADSINEKLFDMFGDTVIDYSSDAPELIEDYICELEQLVT